MNTVLAALALFLSFAISQSNNPPAVYGHVTKVVFEPTADAPERAQIWGTFSVAAPVPGEYQVAERGYLYFSLPLSNDRAETIREWRDLHALATEYGGFVAFARQEGMLRVRTGVEATQDPVSYTPRPGVE